MAKKWVRRSPFAKLTFHTKQRRAFTVGGGDAAQDINATENIVSINTTNTMRDPAGNFSIDLIYKPLYYEAVEPLDLVDIWLDRGGTTMMGIVDSVRKRTAMTERGPRRRITIAGRSLAAIWMFDLVKFFTGATRLPPELQDRNFALRQGEIKLDFYQESAKFAIETLYQNLPALEIKLKDASLKDFINVGDELYVRTGEVLYNLGLTGYQGTMFEYFRKFTGTPFNELWTDSKNGMLYLRLRPTPFNMPDDPESVELPVGNVVDYSWNSRETWTWITGEPYHSIHPDMIREENLRRSHLRAYSIFGVLPGDPLVTQDPYTVFPPLVEEDLYREIGSRDYIQKIEFIPVTKEHLTGPGAVEKFRQYRNKLYLWNKDNHRFEEGTMTIRGDANVRVGEKILRTDTAMTYYVEGVQNRWQFGPPMMTNLTLSRGATEKNRNDWYKAGLDYLRSVGEA